MYHLPLPALPTQPSPEQTLIVRGLEDNWALWKGMVDIEERCEAEVRLSDPASQGLIELMQGIRLQRVSERDAMVAAVTGALGRVRTQEVIPGLWAWYQAEREVDVAITSRQPNPRRARGSTTASTAGRVPR